MRLKKDFATDAPNALPILCVKLSTKDINTLSVEGYLPRTICTFENIPMGLDIIIESEEDKELFATLSNEQTGTTSSCSFIVNMSSL